jgi:hypothetical protein
MKTEKKETFNPSACKKNNVEGGGRVGGGGGCSGNITETFNVITVSYVLISVG